MLKILIIFLTCCLYLPACVQAGDSKPQESGTELASPEIVTEAQILYPLKLGEMTIMVERACTDKEQQQGLMFRKEMPENQGMLFVFSQERELNFWMKDTLIPLSIAYINAQGMIIDIQKMQPLDKTGHLASGPARYALEMNQGWFEKNKISPGALMELADFCRRP